MARPATDPNFQGIERRRVDCLRLLDILRDVPEERFQSHALPRARRPGRPRQPFEVGVCLAGQLSHALQPHSADPEGKPWSERKKLLWWDGQKKKWEGSEPPDFPEDKPPDRQPNWLLFPKGTDAHDGRSPFTLISDGCASLFVTSGSKTAHFPRTTSRLNRRCPTISIANKTTRQPRNGSGRNNPYHNVNDPKYPYVLTTYRLTELHCGGSPTRFVRSNAELQPEGFADIPLELAVSLGIGNLDWVVVSTARGEVETRALVTRRMQPLSIQGRRSYSDWHALQLRLARLRHRSNRQHANLGRRRPEHGHS